MAAGRKISLSEGTFWNIKTHDEALQVIEGPTIPAALTLPSGFKYPRGQCFKCDNCLRISKYSGYSVLCRKYLMRGVERTRRQCSW
jgi:hypothetical protein